MWWVRLSISLNLKLALVPYATPKWPILCNEHLDFFDVLMTKDKESPTYSLINLNKTKREELYSLSKTYLTIINSIICFVTKNVLVVDFFQKVALLCSRKVKIIRQNFYILRPYKLE